MYYNLALYFNLEEIMRADSSGSVRVASLIRKPLQSGKLNTKGCEHVFTIQDVIPSADGCEDCLKTGDEWVHLRLCLTCGYVGCCDDSKNKHASRHHGQTGHPVIVSFEEGENWLWCYVDQQGFDLKNLPDLPLE